MLEGIRIVSFCHYLQGPAGMQYLADMGADVIKIEPPSGAYERHWAGAGRASVGDVSPFFLSGNRNARSLAIDLKHPEARDVVLSLIDQSQVLAENYRPGVMDRLGFGHAQMRARKPDLIYASASGYGEDGPYAERPGQDLLIQAMSGIAGSALIDGRPTPAGFAVADQHGGAVFAIGILGACIRWLRTGEGTHVQSSLLDAGVDLQNESLATYYASRRGAGALTRDRHLGTWFHDAPYGIYAIADGHIAISRSGPERLAVAFPDLDLTSFFDGGAYERRDELAQLIVAELKEQTYEALSRRLENAGIWHARVASYDDLPTDPQLQHNDTFREVDINGVPARVTTHPVRYDGHKPNRMDYALQPGAHTREILGQIGLSDTEIRDLLRNDVVASPG